MSLNDTYELRVDVDPPVWRVLKTRGDRPRRREGHSLSLLPQLGTLVLFGGSDCATEEEYNDVHTFDPETATWSHGE